MTHDVLQDEAVPMLHGAIAVLLFLAQRADVNEQGRRALEEAADAAEWALERML